MKTPSKTFCQHAGYQVVTLWQLCGVLGKGTVIKILKDDKKRRDTLCITAESKDSVRLQSIAFDASCYGHDNESNITALRYLICLKKMSNHKLNSSPELKVLPPTSEAFKQHILSAHFQTIWRSALDPDPPALCSSQYGWKRSQVNSLEPIDLPKDVVAAPK